MNWLKMPQLELFTDIYFYLYFTSPGIASFLLACHCCCNNLQLPFPGKRHDHRATTDQRDKPTIARQIATPLQFLRTTFHVVRSH